MSQPNAPDDLHRQVVAGLDDNQLWAAVRSHPDDADRYRLAFTELYARWRGPFGRIASGRRVDADTTEDAVHLCFEHLLREADRLPTWTAAFDRATRLLHRPRWLVASVYFRSNRRTVRLDAAPDLAGRTPPPDAALGEGELAAAIDRALQALSERQRTVVVLHHMCGQTFAQIARHLGIGEETVKTHAERGRDELRRALARWCPAAAVATTVTAWLAGERAPAMSAARLDEAVRRIIAAAATAPRVGKLPLVLAGVVLAGGLAVGGGVMLMPGTAPPPAAPGRAETLAEKNDRLFRAEVLPDLLAELARRLPPDNPPRFVGVTTAGPRVECEFATTKPLLAAAGPMGLRVRYCTLRRVMEVEADVFGDGKWRWVNPKRPVILDLGIRGIPVMDLDRDGIAFGRRAFGKLPDDDRAEAELVGLLSSEPGGELRLPEHTRSVAGGGDRLFVVAPDSGLFARTAGRWKYLGECRGWFLSVDDDRLYMNGIDGDEGVWTRPAGGVGAKWEKVCDRPAEDWSKYEILTMAVAGGRVHYAGLRRADPRGMVWSRPLNDPTAEWQRHESPVHPRLFTGAGNWLYALGVGRTLVLRAAADPTATWETIGRLPDHDGELSAVGDEVWWFDHSRGPILARPAGGTNEPWRVIGRVRTPAPR